MKYIKHYTEKIPTQLKRKCRRVLDIKLGWFATYADLLDKLFEKGYWIEMQPFHTYSYTDRMAVIYKLWKRDEEGRWICVYDEEKDWSSDDGFGSHFSYCIQLTINNIKRHLENGSF